LIDFYVSEYIKTMNVLNTSKGLPTIPFNWPMFCELTQVLSDDAAPFAHIRTQSKQGQLLYRQVVNQYEMQLQKLRPEYARE